MEFCSQFEQDLVVYRNLTSIAALFSGRLSQAASPLALTRGAHHWSEYLLQNPNRRQTWPLLLFKLFQKPSR